MFDFSSKSVTNSLNINLDSALKSGPVIVSININNKRYPSKTYARTLWSLDVLNDNLQISNLKTSESMKTFSAFDISQIKINIARGFNNAPGKFMTQSLCMKISLKVKDTVYSFICEDLGAIKPLLSFISEYHIEFIDPYSLLELYNEYTSIEVLDVLYAKLEDIEER